jgi:hypothetical protein
MPRHQGKYKPGNSAPYELSRTAIEKMVRCEACFWLEKVKGVETPGRQYSISTPIPIPIPREGGALVSRYLCAVGSLHRNMPKRTVLKK